MEVHLYEITITVPRKSLTDPFRRTLRWLKHSDPKTFQKVIRNLKKIVILRRRGYFNETNVHAQTWQTEISMLEDFSAVPHYLASLLLHEAHHIAQFRAGGQYRGTRAERQAYLVQRKFLQHFKQEHAVRWLDEQFQKKWWMRMPR